MVPPPKQNTVEICSQITLLILHFINSKLLTHPKVINVPVQVSEIFDLTMSFKFISFSFQIFLLLVSEMRGPGVLTKVSVWEHYALNK
jgi:hypothetical protein